MNYYHTTKRMECDPSLNMLHFFGHFSPYYQCQDAYDSNKTNIPHHEPCVTCTGRSTSQRTDEQTNALVNKQVRISSSQHMNHTMSTKTFDKPLASNCQQWNNMSDRIQASVSRVEVPTRGNSTKRSVTKLRPGSMSALGTGVDVKHNSYDRYLRKKKGFVIHKRCV